MVVGEWLFGEEGVVCGNFFELLAWKAARFRTCVFDKWKVELVQVKCSGWCI